MSWLEEINTTTGVVMFGVATTTGVAYMKLYRDETDAFAVVDVDAQRFRPGRANPVPLATVSLSPAKQMHYQSC
jgi:hypothetical protein